MKKLFRRETNKTSVLGANSPFIKNCIYPQDCVPKKRQSPRKPRTGCHSTVFQRGAANQPESSKFRSWPVTFAVPIISENFNYHQRNRNERCFIKMSLENYSIAHPNLHKTLYQCHALAKIPPLGPKGQNARRRSLFICDPAAWFPTNLLPGRRRSWNFKGSFRPRFRRHELIRTKGTRII